MKNYQSSKPVFVGKNNVETELKIKSGIDTDTDISDAVEGIVVVREGEEPPLVIGVKNPMNSSDWAVIVNRRKNPEGFEGIDFAPSADIFIKTSPKDQKVFKLINGRLAGKLGDRSYTVTYEPSASLLRIYADQKLTALFQPLKNGEESDLKLVISESETKLAEIVSLHQAYYQIIYSLEKS